MSSRQCRLMSIGFLKWGTMKAADAERLLEQLSAVQRELHQLRKGADANPEQYEHYAMPGQAANKPSDN